MLKRKRDTQVGAMGMNGASVNLWCPGETAFKMQRMIIQRYFSGEVEDRCTICLEDLEQRMTTYLPCKHAFHYKCWQQMVEQRTYLCPLCRFNFSEALPVVGIVPVSAEDDVDNIAVLTIFTHMDLYDFMLELLWRNYEREAEREIDEEE